MYLFTVFIEGIANNHKPEKSDQNKMIQNKNRTKNGISSLFSKS